MRFSNCFTHLLLILLLAFMGFASVSAKTVSGFQNLEVNWLQGQTVSNCLMHQEKTQASQNALSGCLDVAKSAGKASDNVIRVTKDGVAFPPGSKYKIPDNYVQNPHRSGNYGEIINGKYKERLRIDPPTQPGKKGPNYSHYHKNGKGTHYSPRPGDSDPGF